MSRKQELLVTKDECKQMRSDCQSANEKISLALWGTDGRGGMVNDIQEIKSQLKVYGGVLGRFALPIAVAVIVAVLVKFL